MEPKTRNRGLMVGGGVLLMLLLLVCGPLEGMFGSDAQQKTPDVAAGPPPGNIGAAAGVAAAGAAAGAAIGESDIAGIIEGRDAAASASDGSDGAFGAGIEAGQGAAGAATSGAGAAIGAGASATGAAIASATSGSGSGSASRLGPAAAAFGAPGPVKSTSGSIRGSLPSVSAGVPVSSLPMVAAAEPFSGTSRGPSAAEVAAAAANEFDVAAANVSTTGLGAAGKVVDRFAPPVESGPVDSRERLRQADAFGAGVLRPCDSPGAGCQNVSAIVNRSINPPIRPLGPPPGAGGTAQ